MRSRFLVRPVMCLMLAAVPAFAETTGGLHFFAPAAAAGHLRDSAAFSITAKNREDLAYWESELKAFRKGTSGSTLTALRAFARGRLETSLKTLQEWRARLTKLESSLPHGPKAIEQSLAHREKALEREELALAQMVAIVAATPAASRRPMLPALHDERERARALEETYATEAERLLPPGSPGLERLQAAIRERQSLARRVVELETQISGVEINGHRQHGWRPLLERLAHLGE